jgi:hypothetical protein
MRRWDLALVFLLLASWPLAGNAAPRMVLARGARIGILNLLDAGITHFHMAKKLEGRFLKTQYVSWRIDLMLAGALKERLDALGLIEVPVNPSEVLSRSKEGCFLNATLGKGLPRECSAIFAQLCTAMQLDAIIVLGPGLNNSVHGEHYRDLPDYLRGWGFVTGMRRGPGSEAAVFNLTELLLIGVDRGAAQLAARDWGGSQQLVDWPTFSVPPEQMELPRDELDKLAPVLEEELKSQCNRLLDQVDVSEGGRVSAPPQERRPEPRTNAPASSAPAAGPPSGA